MSRRSRLVPALAESTANLLTRSASAYLRSRVRFFPSAGRKWRSAVLVFAAALAVSSTSAAAEPLRMVRTIPLPDVTGRIDHLAVDLQGRRLFLAALEK